MAESASTMNKSKLLILGGKPIASVDIVQYAKSLDVWTIVCDYLEVSQSPAKQIADECWLYSTADVEAICAKAREEKVTAVFTGCHEFNISKCREVCEKLNLPFYATAEQWNSLSDKNKYLSLFASYGLPSIPNQLLAEGQNVNHIQLPVVIKPVDASGGFGITICYRYDKIKKALENAFERSKSKKVLIEPCIQAPEVTLFYIVVDGEIRLSAMADRYTQKIKDEIMPLPYLYKFPSVYIDNFISKYNNTIIQVLHSLHVQNGMLFMQAFWDNGQLYIYDVGYRLTGTQEYHLLEHICGYNPMKMLVNYALNGNMQLNGMLSLTIDPMFCGKRAAIITYLMKPGKIAKLHKGENPDLLHFIWNHSVGDEIVAEGTLTQIIARAYIVADTDDQLQKKIEGAKNLVSVYDINDNNLIIPFVC